jgi:hypothetical protein
MSDDEKDMGRTGQLFEKAFQAPCERWRRWKGRESAGRDCWNDQRLKHGLVVQYKVKPACMQLSNGDKQGSRVKSESVKEATMASKVNENGKKVSRLWCLITQNC